MPKHERVWFSLCFTGLKIGVNAKYPDHDWEAPTHNIPPTPPEVDVEYEKHILGFWADPALMPKAIYAFDPKRFNRVVDVFFAGMFKAVKGETAEALKQAEWGGGGLVPVPVYEADRKTLRNENAHIINFDKPVDCFLPEQSSGLKRLSNFRGITWRASPLEPVPTIAVSGEAVRNAPDMWYAPNVRTVPFFSDRFVSLVTDKRTRKALDFQECVVV